LAQRAQGESLKIDDNEIDDNPIPVCVLVRLTTRWQIPLMMAYAISIHKAQGMTIAMLDVSFQGMFEYGQAYVALSRATDWENLYLRHFDASSVRVHSDVSKSSIFHESVCYVYLVSVGYEVLLKLRIHNREN
jgi:ATP-dependent exoDNAse (exonuclease V) alpha subunit